MSKKYVVCPHALIQCLSEILPVMIRVQIKLLGLVDSKTQELRCSLMELSKLLNYNHLELYYWLNGLAVLGLVSFNHPANFHQKFTIIITMNH
jgi:hypothetical protein